jgi:colicin import membrane protein
LPVRRPSDRWISLSLSVLLHGALLAALVYGWLLFRRPSPPAPTLAIEAHVVDEKAVKGMQQAPPQPVPPPEPEETAAEPEGPPQPTAEELAQREQERQKAEAAAEEQRVAEQHAAEQHAAEQRAAEAAAALAAQRKAEEQRQAEARAEKERKAQEAAEAKQRATEERESEADLQRSLAAEEHASEARSGPALAKWQALIAAKITQNWRRPPTARPGIECVLNVTQVPGGEVTQVTIGQCNGDEAVRESIEAAVYRASPLPPPPDPALFDRNLTINFKPD